LRAVLPGPAPDEGICFVSRLWSRFGLRSLALGLLALSLAGGYRISADRHAQQHPMQADAAADRLLAGPAPRGDDPMMSVDQGHRAARAAAQVAADAAAQAAADQARAADEAARKQQETSRNANRPAPTPTTPKPDIPASCSAYSGNQALACAILPQFGFGIDQMSCLVPLWNKESGWNPKSRNPSTGATGIPQALPASKMAIYGQDYLTNPVPQIKWGISYTKSRYGSPCAAWSYWQAHGYY
jgi:hypothetical protein